jgi:hypothetical protein
MVNSTCGENRATQAFSGCRLYMSPMRYDVDLARLGNPRLLLPELLLRVPARASASQLRKTWTEHLHRLRSGVSCWRCWETSPLAARVLNGVPAGLWRERTNDELAGSGLASWHLRWRGESHSRQRRLVANVCHQYQLRVARASTAVRWVRQSQCAAGGSWQSREMLDVDVLRQALAPTASADAPLVDRQAREGRSRACSPRPLAAAILA